MASSSLYEILAAFCAILSPLLGMGGGGMNIGARTGCWAGGGKPTARDYVQDGLIAMWDGIENAGWGTHDASATTWKDLIGSEDLTVPVTYGVSFYTNALHFSGDYDSSAAYLKTSGLLGIENNITIEVSFSRDIMVGQWICPFGSVEYGGCGIQFGNSNIIYFPVGNPNGGYYENIGYMYGNSKSASLTFKENEKLKGYLNGVNVYKVDSVTGIRWNYNYRNFYIGSDAGDFGKGCWKADIFSIRVYNRAISSDEVAYNHAIDKARFNLT